MIETPRSRAIAIVLFIMTASGLMRSTAEGQW